MENKQSRWLRDYEIEAASGGRFKKHMLRKDRLENQRFPFHRIGRSVYYDLTELDATIEEARFGGKAQRAA